MNKDPEYILKQYIALKSFLIDNSVLLAVKSEIPSSLTPSPLSNKPK